MKKSLVALAALGCVGAASAQSNVILFGIVDASVSYGDGSIASKTQLSNSGYNSSRLGLRGVEDMGGGLFAGFWLEAGINNDNGSFGTTNTNNQLTGASGGGGMTFNRRSTVSVGNKWGELRLGRDYTPQFWNQTVYDPFGTNGVGTTATQHRGVLPSTGNMVTGVRASNSVSLLYGTPFNGTSIGGPGFHGSLMYYMGENLDNTPAKDDGSGWGTRIGWNGGPFSVAGAYSNTDFSTVGDLEQWNVGGSWDLGIAQIMGNYVNDEFKNGPKGQGWTLGFTWPLGQHLIRGSWSTYELETQSGVKSGTVDQFAVGYVYNLSKRTALYATYAYADNDDGASYGANGSVTRANESSWGMDFGIRHIF
jgi:predicted porin